MSTQRTVTLSFGPLPQSGEGVSKAGDIQHTAEEVVRWALVGGFVGTLQGSMEGTSVYLCVSEAHVETAEAYDGNEPW